jgi:hypothetical protein
MFNGINQFKFSKKEQVKTPSLVEKGMSRLKSLFQKKGLPEVKEPTVETNIPKQETVTNLPKIRSEGEMKSKVIRANQLHLSNHF